MLILIQFLLRLAFGTAICMACLSPRHVASGYFRNQAYVLLGLSVLAAMASWAAPGMQAWPAVTAAGLAYASSVCWLYEWSRPGRITLAALAFAALAGAWMAEWAPGRAQLENPSLLAWLEAPTSGLVLGATLAAMLLGHWYLNAPGMKLDPLRWLVLCMGIALVVRGVVCGVAFGLHLAGNTGQSAAGPAQAVLGWLTVLRWLAGIVGAGGASMAAWQTLKVPNTQSATGILYVGVMFTFVGELSALLLSAEATHPL